MTRMIIELHSILDQVDAYFAAWNAAAEAIEVCWDEEMARQQQQLLNLVDSIIPEPPYV